MKIQLTASISPVPPFQKRQSREMVSWSIQQRCSINRAAWFLSPIENLIIHEALPTSGTQALLKSDVS